MAETIIAFAPLAGPLVLLPAVLRHAPGATRSSVFALFVVPLVGAVTYGLLAGLGLGAVVGGVFMLLYAVVVSLPTVEGEATFVVRSFVAGLVAGIVGGGFVGCTCVRATTRRSTSCSNP